VSVFFIKNHAQSCSFSFPFLRLNLNPELSSQGQKPQDTEHAPFTCPRPQYLETRLAGLLSVNQLQSPGFSLSRVNLKAPSSTQEDEGAEVGNLVGVLVGLLVGASDVGVEAGESEGEPVGVADGLILDVGLLVGTVLGSLLGLLVGESEGTPLGSADG